MVAEDSWDGVDPSGYREQPADGLDPPGIPHTTRNCLRVDQSSPLAAGALSPRGRRFDPIWGQEAYGPFLG